MLCPDCHIPGSDVAISDIESGEAVYDWNIKQEEAVSDHEVKTLSGMLLAELLNVAENQPLFPGDTVSHAGAAELQKLRYIKRSANGRGDWVLTDLGKRMITRGKQ